MRTFFNEIKPNDRNIAMFKVKLNLFSPSSYFSFEVSKLINIVSFYVTTCYLKISIN